MKLSLVIVGRDRGDPLIEAADVYLKRVERYLPVSLIQLKEEPLKKNSAVPVVQRAEAARIRGALKSVHTWVAMDERGRAMTSPEWAARLERWMVEGTQELGFVIGGPSGLDPALRREAGEVWALSKLTLPHRMARLLLSEQLYRAMTIIRNEPYHK